MYENKKHILVFGILFIVLCIAVGVLVWKSVHINLLPPKQPDSSQSAVSSESATTAPLKIILGGMVVAMTDTTLSFELLNIPPKKVVVLTLRPDTGYFKEVFSGNSEAAKLVPLQKDGIKKGDYISVIFSSAIDVNSLSPLSPDSINLLPPPPLPQK